MNDCCAKLENRELGPGPRGLEDTPPPEVVVSHCRVCECRHFEVVADPGTVGVQGKAL